MRFTVVVSVVLSVFAAVDAAPPQAKKPLDPEHAAKAKAGLALFKSDVRTLLVKNCLECHGGKSIKADFDLSTRKKLIDSGYVEKTAEDSHLMALIRHDEEPAMPFKAKKLPAEAIAKIAKWIDLGAPYDKPLVDAAEAVAKAGVVTDADREFWSFRPLAEASPPTVKNDAWARTAVDRFVLSKLEAAGIAPNERADRRTLIRRVTFDLTGLPPTVDEVRAFVADPASDADAYAKVVDRLLDSPHYGERWARHWMDVARFAESHGYEQDYDRKNAYHYRDFLVKALNADMPYDRFVRWQLAGDEVAPDEPLAWMATGFLGAGAFPTQLTETEFESARYDELDDVVGTIGTAFLGLTIGCARCHDHKFDPMPAVDYYRMASTFTTTIRSEIPLALDTEGHRARHAEWLAKHETLTKRLREHERGPLTKALRDWLAKNDKPDAPPTAWAILEPQSVTSKGGATLQAQPDGSILATGKKPANDEYTFTARTTATGLRTIRLEALTHDSLVRQGPGRAGNGNFALSDFRVTVRSRGVKDAKPQPVKLVDARATHQQNESSLSVKSSIDGDPVSGWAVDFGGIGKDQAAVFVAERAFGFEGGTEITITMPFRNNTQHALGRFRVSVSADSAIAATVGNGVPSALNAAFTAARTTAFDKLDPKHRTALLHWFGGRDTKYGELVADVAKSTAAEPKAKTVTVQVNTEGMPHMRHHADGRGYPHFYPQTHVLSRGDVHQKERVAEQGFLQVLMREGTTPTNWKVDPPSPQSKQSYRRASLANWITDVDRGAGHLLARVIVNRLWHHHFGRGIVATPSDFGFQGERPTHPELLDWLARDLVANGWTLKRTHRLLVTSAVYTQSSDFDETRAKVDRDNALRWRWSPRRLEAEAIRDGMLHVSQLLDDTMYGPGTLDPNHRRRSLYFFVKRSRLIPMMMLFDWPEHLVGIGRRGTTTIAPQALAFLNGPQCRQYAEGLANRLNDAEQKAAVAEAYDITFGRPVTARESAVATAFLSAQAERYTQAGKPNANRLALVDLCQALLSSNEFVYLD